MARWRKLLKRDILKRVFANYGFKRKEVTGNGDCSFLAVAHGIEGFLQDATQTEI